MDTLASYDQLPYDSLPLPETQLDFLAAVARLHGFDAPDPRHARILELGCAQGGNLIPLAWRWPESACVGVELSRVQAESGADFIRRLGLTNVRIVHGDLAALPADLGVFDYIIAHGVFSWVPPAVQQALLDVCRRHLSPQGVAYVSFNVAAGWAALLSLRAQLVERTAADLPAPARLGEALRVLDELEDAWGLPPEGMAGRWLDAEAALDEAHLTRFRRALIARADAPCAQPPRIEALSDLAFYADLRCDDEIDLEAACEQAFINPAGNAFPVADPAMKAGAMILAMAYPGSLDYSGLLAGVRQVMAECCVAGKIDENAFRAALYQLVMTHGVMPGVSALSYVNEPGERPRAHDLARLQARSPGWVVSGARHVAMDLDAPGRILLGLLDGSRTIDALAVIMQARLADAGEDRSLETVSEMTRRQLWLFARQGLLVAPVRMVSD